VATWVNGFLGYRTVPGMDDGYFRDSGILLYLLVTVMGLRKVFVYPFGMLPCYIRLLKFYK
jgi:hypothetical protein